jgi:hypothetical protein
MSNTLWVSIQKHRKITCWTGSCGNAIPESYVRILTDHRRDEDTGKELQTLNVI